MSDRGDRGALEKEVVVPAAAAPPAEDRAREKTPWAARVSLAIGLSAVAVATVYALLSGSAGEMTVLRAAPLSAAIAAALVSIFRDEDRIWMLAVGLPGAVVAAFLPWPLVIVLALVVVVVVVVVVALGLALQ